MTGGTESETVLSEQRGSTLVVRLNRPEARNAINSETARGLAAALDALDADPELKVGILTGAGKGFSAGMDLKAFVRGEALDLPGRGFAGITEATLSKPLIAAVEGFAIAGGFEIVLACDLIVASRTAVFELPEVRLGLVASAGGLLRLPRRLPYHVAMEMALTGTAIGAERLHELGLVNRIAPPGGALAGALALAGEVDGGAPLALAATKEIIARSLDWSAEEAWCEQATIAGPVERSDDAAEGARAFAEKRAPRWSGR